MWKRVAAGREFHFYLAGINNQNFLMRDRETGSWWQQINGKAIFGPLQGTTLELATGDELSFGLWKRESPGGQVLVEVPKYSKEYDSGWEPKVAKLPVVLNPGTLGARDVVIGLELGGAARAYPVDALVKQSPVQDHVAGQSLLVAVGPDGKSVRAFLSQTAGGPPTDLEFFRKTGTDDWLLVDSATGSEWNFEGCAVSGSSQGKCLQRVTALRDYWFDWKNYHPATSIYRR